MPCRTRYEGELEKNVFASLNNFLFYSLQLKIRIQEKNLIWFSLKLWLPLKDSDTLKKKCFRQPFQLLIVHVVSSYFQYEDNLEREAAKKKWATERQRMRILWIVISWEMLSSSIEACTIVKSIELPCAWNKKFIFIITLKSPLCLRQSWKISPGKCERKKNRSKYLFDPHGRIYIFHFERKSHNTMEGVNTFRCISATANFGNMVEVLI